MRKPILLRALLLLCLSDLASSIPVLVQPSTETPDIWVRKSNTLNSSTLRSHQLGTPTFAGVILHQAGEISIPKGPTQANSENIAFQDTDGAIHIAQRRAERASITTNPRSISGPLNGTNITTTTTGARNVSASGVPKADAPSLNSTTQWSWNSTRSRLAFPQAFTLEAAAGALTISLVNRMPSSNVKAYISGLDSNGALILLGQNGAWVYPTTNSPVPQPVDRSVELSLGPPNSTTSFTLPGYIESARVWVAEGGLQFFLVTTPNGPGLVEPASANPKDPNAEVNYAFAELSWSAQYGLYADITNVDFVGLPLGIKLVNTNNSAVSVLGTPANAARELCDQLTTQSQVDGWPWKNLCAYTSSGSLIRVLAPATLTATQPDIFRSYYARYVNDVWNHYRTNDLIIDTQAAPGNVTCRVQGKELQCAGDNRGYAKPNNFDIFGCNTGPFAIQAGDNAVHYAVVPRLCAAFNRATLLIQGGNVQPSLPPARYYRNENRPPVTRPKNWYSELVHEMEVGGRGYAFSYDDVAPSSGLDQSGLVGSTNPQTLTIFVGGT